METLLHPSIFRSYDIRGIVGEYITNESLFLIGKAIGSLLRDLQENKIILGRDGRLSSEELAKSLSAGIQSSGCDVIDIGMLATPLMYYATHVLDVNSGVIVTGSHNPADYNGIKMVIKGKTLSEEEIKQLYHRIVENHLYDGEGTRTEKNIQTDYIAEVLKDIYLTRPLSIVIDAGNGAAGHLAPKLFKALGCEVYELFCEVDGNFPHHHPDPSQPENLQDLIRVVKEKQADIGLAFDGDGDRLGVVTNRGTIIASDRVLMLFAKTLLAEQGHGKIIFDVKCTDHLPALIKTLGGEAVMCKTGHSFIKAKLAETQGLLAGEVSGHLFFNDRWFGFDDALYAGARLLEIMAHASEDCESIFASIPNSVITPELKVLVDEEKKFCIMQELIAAANFKRATDINMLDGLRVSFDEGWGLVRPSNTTPYLILRFEASNENFLRHMQTLFREWMLSVVPELALPF